jgi:hypothetical protein
VKARADLHRAKPGLFSAVEAGWTSEDWVLARDKLAAVLEYDQGNDQLRATELATAQTFKKYGPCPPTGGRR